MCNEAVDARAKVDMPDGSLLEDFLRDVEILMKIVSAGDATWAVEVAQTRIFRPNFPRLPGRNIHFGDLTIIIPEMPQSFQTGVECGQIQSERPCPTA